MVGRGGRFIGLWGGALSRRIAWCALLLLDFFGGGFGKFQHLIKFRFVSPAAWRLGLRCCYLILGRGGKIRQISTFDQILCCETGGVELGFVEIFPSLVWAWHIGFWVSFCDGLGLHGAKTKISKLR